MSREIIYNHSYIKYLLEVGLPSARTISIGALTDEQLNVELEKGYADITAGRAKSAKRVFNNIRKDYGSALKIYMASAWYNIITLSIMIILLPDTKKHRRNNNRHRFGDYNRNPDAVDSPEQRKEQNCGCLEYKRSQEGYQCGG